MEGRGHKQHVCARAECLARRSFSNCEDRPPLPSKIWPRKTREGEGKATRMSYQSLQLQLRAAADALEENPGEG